MNTMLTRHLDPLIYLLQESGDITHDLLIASQEYDHNIMDIMRYYCKDVRDINDREIADVTSADIEQTIKKKALLWTEYEKVKALERELPILPSIILFAFDISTSIALGILLNIAVGSFEPAIVAFVIFSYQCIGRLYLFITQAVQLHHKSTRLHIDQGVQYFLSQPQNTGGRDISRSEEIELRVQN
jgi:hypothetical protein